MADDPADRLIPYERAMFRVAVGVGLALLPVFAVSVVAGPGWAALVLLVRARDRARDLVAAAAARPRTRRASRPGTPPLTS